MNVLDIIRSRAYRSCKKFIRKNTTAVSFIPLFVQLAIDFKSFHDEEREGVFIEGHPGNTVLQYLVASTDEVSNANHHQLVDTTSFAVY